MQTHLTSPECYICSWPFSHVYP